MSRLRFHFHVRCYAASVPYDASPCCLEFRSQAVGHFDGRLGIVPAVFYGLDATAARDVIFSRSYFQLPVECHRVCSLYQPFSKCAFPDDYRPVHVLQSPGYDFRRGRAAAVYYYHKRYFRVHGL